MSVLIESQLKDLDLGSQKWFETQKAIIKSRPLVRACYEKWYREFSKAEATVPTEQKGIILELGSGGSYLNEFRKDVVTSDIIPGVADYVIQGTYLPFADRSVRAIFMSHSFHHIPDVEKFFQEVSRVLVSGGILFMVEVAHTPFAKFFFSKLCQDEGYDDKAKSWKFSQSDAMSDANQALSWIVFERDYFEFQRKFPELRLEKRRFLPWLGYLLSGGVTRRNFIPTFLSPLVHLIEGGLKLFAPLFSLHWLLTIRKEK